MSAPRHCDDILFYGDIRDASEINLRLLDDFGVGRTHPDSHATHYFSGRYENIYIPREQVPAMEPVIRFAESQADSLLNLGGEPLKTGFWFNEMLAGHETLPHRHDEDDELLSGVYYISVPPGSGDFFYRSDDVECNITPRPGLMLLFSPDLEHWVGQNNSGGLRLSAGFNIGPANGREPSRHSGL